MNTLQEMLAASREYDLSKVDFAIKPRELELLPSGALAGPALFQPAGLNYEPTEWAMVQMYRRLGEKVLDMPIPYRLMQPLHQRVPAETVALTNALIQRMDLDATPWLVRTYRATLRAVLTTAYTPFGNTEILESIQQAVDDGKFAVLSLTGPWLTADGFHARIGARFRNTADGPYEVGAFASNGEIGDHGVWICPYFKRGSCENSLIMSKNQFKAPHRGSKVRILNEVYVALQEAYFKAEEWLTRFLALTTVDIPRFDELVESAIAAHPEWGDDRVALAVLIGQGSEGRNTQAGFINGLTFAARSQPQEVSLAMEEVAGEYLAHWG